MIMEFIKEFLFPALCFTACSALVVLFIFWIVDVMSSVVRAADALERIADALECDDEDEDDNEEEGGAK